MTIRDLLSSPPIQPNPLYSQPLDPNLYPLSEFMSEPEQPPKPLPTDDSIIVKLFQGTRIFHGSNVVIDAANSPLHIPTKELVEKVATAIVQPFKPLELFRQGIRVEILEPEKKWVTGKIRLRLVFEFVPDESENNKTPGEFVSPLDEIRKRSV